MCKTAYGTLLALLLVPLGGCEEKHGSLTEGPIESTTATTAQSAQATDATPATPASVDAGASDAGGASTSDAGITAMPERPIPRPQTMVRSTMPIEVQQKAIAYMAAMRAPRAEDANADPAYADELANKLRPIVLALDNGPKKSTMNRVDVIASGRQIDLLMSAGCDDKTPARAVVTRAGVPLATLAQHGVLVVRCNDAKVQCLQSTRDTQDVLCTTGYRHK